MPEAIPVEPGIPHQRLEVTLSGRLYVMDVRWNERAATFYIDLLDTDLQPIAVGMRAVLGALLGNQSASEDFPPGFLTLHDTKRSGAEAGLDDLGDRVQLLYITAAEASTL